MDQISISAQTPTKPSQYVNKFRSTFFDSFFYRKGLFHNSDLLNHLFKFEKGREKLSDNNIILELKKNTGKTTSAFVASTVASLENGGNVLIVYPSLLQAKLAYSYFKEILKEINMPFLNIFCHLTEDSLFKEHQLVYPGIFITDVFTLHKSLLSNVHRYDFYSRVVLVVLEDIENYKGDFGENVAILFRRLFAKLEYYNSRFCLLGTMSPMVRRDEFVNRLTSVENYETVNRDSQKKHSVQFIHWYLPIETVEFITENTFRLTRKKFSEELSNLVRSVLRDKSCIVIYWQNTILTSDDIANLKRSIEPPENQELFIANDLNNIENKLLQRDKRWKDVDSIIIIGESRPIKAYLDEFIHFADSTDIILFSERSPALQYQVYRLMADSNEYLSDSDIQPNVCMIKKSSINIEKKHCDFFKEELPKCPEKILKKYFSDEFIDYYFSESREAQFGKFMYLAEGLRRYPRAKRKDHHLLVASEKDAFELCAEDNKKLGFLSKDFVFINCYKGSNFVFNDNLYRVKNVNYKQCRVSVHKTNQNYLTTKIASYEIGDEIASAREYDYFNSQIILRSGVNTVQEYIIGCKRENQVSIINSEGFDQENLPIITIDFSKVPFNEYRSEILDKFQNTSSAENWVNIFSVLHTIAHLLIEMSRAWLPVQKETIKLAIEIDEKNIKYYLHIIDLTARQTDLFELIETKFEILLMRAFKVLKECPCNKGTYACINISYCNIQKCEDQLEKLPTFTILGHLLNSIGEQIDIEELLHFKIFDRHIDPEGEGRTLQGEDISGEIITRGILRDQISKLRQMEKMVKNIYQNKMFIDYGKDYFPSNFMTRATIHQLTQIYGECPLGYCEPGRRVINYMPGLSESILFQTIFHERFHNYQYMKNNFNFQRLQFFNWESTDDERNIPYAGLLVLEGSAQYFTMRGMEFFDFLEGMEYVEQGSLLEYRSGLNMFVNLEKEVGFLGIIELIAKGFDIIEYRDYYYPEINTRINSIIQQNPNELRCFQQNNTINEQYANRLSYFFQRGRLNLAELVARIQRYLRRRISRTEALAIAHSQAQDTLVPQFRDLWLRYGLWDLDYKQEEDRNNPICASCESNCTFHDACMLNGGEQILIEYLRQRYRPRGRRR